MSLKSFDRIIAKAHEDQIQVVQNISIPQDLIRLDISNIRDYLIPKVNRKEHYRWQFCGPGRTILRHIKVKEAYVKEHIRKGKRI